MSSHVDCDVQLRHARDDIIDVNFDRVPKRTHTLSVCQIGSDGTPTTVWFIGPSGKYHVLPSPPLHNVSITPAASVCAEYAPSGHRTTHLPLQCSTVAAS